MIIGLVLLFPKYCKEILFKTGYRKLNNTTDLNTFLFNNYCWHPDYIFTGFFMLRALFIKTVIVTYHHKFKFIHWKVTTIKHLQYSWYFSLAITAPGSQKNGYGFTCKQRPYKIACKRIYDIRIIVWLEPISKW